MQYKIRKKLIAFKSRNAGFTLVELLLAIGIASFVLSVSSYFLATILEAQTKNETISEVEDQGRYTMSIITQYIRNADTINTPGVSSSANTLSLNTIIPANNPIVFDLNTGVVRMTEGANLAINLTNSKVTISNLNFQNLSKPDSPGVLKISFTVTGSSTSGRYIYTFSKDFSTSASLR